MKVISLCSGGADSVVMSFSLREAGHDVHLLHVDYGQVPSVAEVASVRYFAKECAFGEPTFLAVPTISSWGMGSLVDEQAEVEMFPHRNLLLLATASVVAAHLEFDGLAIGIINSSMGQFADCRQPFISRMRDVLNVDDPKLALFTPLADMNKSQVVQRGIALKVPLPFTFSCNRLNHRHCWRCASCLERLETFSSLNVSF